MQIFLQKDAKSAKDIGCMILCALCVLLFKKLLPELRR